jgi:RNA-binding protein
MRTLTSAARRTLRAKAHPLRPVVSIGTNGLTPSVLHEIDVNLLAHELIKVRVFGDDRNERERLFLQVCADLGAAPVQHLGKTLTLWRPSPAPEPVQVKAKTRPAAPSGSRRRATR